MNSVTKKLSFLPLALTLFGAANAQAWGPIGHETVGEIAERNLSPKGKALVFQILGPEPLSGASNWPDVVRSDSRYKSFANYHFVTLPKGKKYSEVSHPEKNMYSIVELAMKKLVRPDVSRDEKMVLLRYLAHMIGDIHQPLHVGRPGEMGGNLCSVKIKNPISDKYEEVNIHHVWDEVLIDHEKKDYIAKNSKDGRKPWFGYYEYANVISKIPSYESLREKAMTKAIDAEEIQQWLFDSAELGDQAYPYVRGETKGRAPYCRWQDPETGKVEDGGFRKYKIPRLGASYIAESLPTVRTQIALAGFRLARILNQLGEQVDAPSASADEQKAFIKAVQSAIKP